MTLSSEFRVILYLSLKECLRKKNFDCDDTDDDDDDDDDDGDDSDNDYGDENQSR